MENLKPNDVVRVRLSVTGRDAFEWEDIIDGIDNIGWCVLKDARIRIETKNVHIAGKHIKEGTRVEMWNGGDDTSGAFMGWYVEYNKITGKHLVSSVKNKLEGRKWWDNARSVEEQFANELLRAK